MQQIHYNSTQECILHVCAIQFSCKTQMVWAMPRCKYNPGPYTRGILGLGGQLGLNKVNFRFLFTNQVINAPDYWLFFPAGHSLLFYSPCEMFSFQAYVDCIQCHLCAFCCALACRCIYNITREKESDPGAWWVQRLKQMDSLEFRSPNPAWENVTKRRKGRRLEVGERLREKLIQIFMYKSLQEYNFCFSWMKKV